MYSTSCARALPELTHSGKIDQRETATKKHITHFYLSSGGKNKTKIWQCPAGIIDICMFHGQDGSCCNNKERTGLQILNSRKLYFLLHRSRWFPFPHWTSTHQPCNMLNARGSPCCSLSTQLDALHRSNDIFRHKKKAGTVSSWLGL